MALLAIVVCAGIAQAANLSDYVNPLIGTEGAIPGSGKRHYTPMHFIAQKDSV